MMDDEAWWPTVLLKRKKCGAFSVVLETFFWLKIPVVWVVFKNTINAEVYEKNRCFPWFGVRKFILVCGLCVVRTHGVLWWGAIAPIEYRTVSDPRANVLKKFLALLT